MKKKPLRMFSIAAMGLFLSSSFLPDSEVDRDAGFVPNPFSVIGRFFSGASWFGPESDHRIESFAKQSYVFKTYLKGDRIRVTSQNGMVSVTGTIAEEMHGLLAQETVRNIPGVRNVDNRLKLKNGCPVQCSDRWLGVKVKLVLCFHRNVSARRTDVHVQDGIVFLRGIAASWDQRSLAAEYARSVAGVRGVKNYITLACPFDEPQQALGEKIDDASITAQIKVALQTHRAINGFDIGVKTRDGVVTLSGRVRDITERELITKIVSDIYGVRGVSNKMVL